MRFCDSCGTETTNPRFCSKTCSARTTNREAPRRVRKPHPCSVCGTPILVRRKFCDECRPTQMELRPLSQIHGLGSSSGKHPSWRNAIVRNYCRKANSHRLRICENCDYSTHTEFCHIQPISSFPPTATLAEINAEANVAILCRNCHWEFDNQLLSLSEFRPRTGPVS